MTSAVRVRVLYEDTRNGDQPYPLHDLVLQCIADVSGATLWTLRQQVEANPRGGNGNVIRDLPSPDGRPQVAVLDSDKIASQPLVKAMLKRDNVLAPTFGDLSRAAHAAGKAGDKTAVVLLVENVESIIEAIATCSPYLDPETVKKARLKKLAARDIVINKAVHDRALRDCVLQRVPSLALLRDKVHCGLLLAEELRA